MATLPKPDVEDSFLGDSRPVVMHPEVRILPYYHPVKPSSCLTEATTGFGPFAVPKAAPWILDVARDILRFMSLNADWDSYGGDAVDQATAEAALRVLMVMSQTKLPRPSVFAEAAGGVGFEFCTPRAELTLIVHRPGEMSYYFEDLVNGVEREGEGLPPELAALAIDW